MIDKTLLDEMRCRDKGCDDLRIAACKSGSGAVKELVFCQLDGCYYVTVDGRERLRSDVPETAYRYFSGPAPE
ncbi:hypothetical protein [Magnetospirillum sp. UT-4]|uniref:hypothetical protein n=1 Tax=Magnetospirillum sp. UT-4 TaxID=2681467 RepID=UPI0015728CF6|nr:hypothetical protein [Magnetospirillum sp. UT-4]